jgi:hypothetical protein
MHSLLRPLALALMISAISSCATKPDSPSFDNPYDPNGTGPDPYGLMASVDGDSVLLQWTDNDGILTWAVFHSTTSATDGFNAIDSITITRPAGNGVATAGHHDFSPAVANWYRLQGSLASGELRSIGQGDPAVITPAPLVRLLGGGDVSSTRFVTLEVRSDLGESVELSNTADFASFVTANTQAGVLDTVAFTLPTVSSVPSTVYVHARNRVGTSIGIQDSTRLFLGFTPTFSIASGQRISSTGASVVDTALVLAVEGEGVSRARVADSSAGLASAPWEATPDAINWTLSSSDTEADTIFAEVEGDLGVNVETSLLYSPAATVSAASLGVVGDLESTLDPQIQLASDADGAGEMIFSEDPAFIGATWVAFADTTDYTLSIGFGEKIIFARYRNAFDSVGTSAVARVFLLGGP